MAEGNDYSSIKPLNETSQKEAMPFLGIILLLMVVTFVGLFVIGAIIGSL